MRHRHRHSDSTEEVAALLGDRHGSELTAEQLAEALETLNLKIVAADETSSAVAPISEGTPDGLVCMDGPIGCDGDLTTLLDSRHIRCERHWSLFLESEGM